MTLHLRVCFVKLTEYIAITLNEKTCLSVCRRQCPTERCVGESNQEAQIRTLFDKQKKQILAECQAESNRHEFQAAYDRRSLRKLGENVESQQEELHCARAEEVQRRDQQLLQGQLLHQNLELREAHQKSLTEMEKIEEVSEFHLRHYCKTKIGRGSEHYLGTRPERVQELQNEVNCMSDSKDFSRCW